MYVILFSLLNEMVQVAVVTVTDILVSSNWITITKYVATALTI